jgi:hypothetical protein
MIAVLIVGSVLLGAASILVGAGLYIHRQIAVTGQDYIDATNELRALRPNVSLRLTTYPTPTINTLLKPISTYPALGGFNLFAPVELYVSEEWPEKRQSLDKTYK